MLFSSYRYMYALISVTFPLFVIYIHSLFFNSHVCEIPYGQAVRIPGFHPGGSGSTPGMGTHAYFKITLLSDRTLQVVYLVLAEFVKVRSFATTLLQKRFSALCPSQK